MKLHWWMRKWRYGAALKKIKDGSVILDVGCSSEYLFLSLVESRVKKGYGIDKKIIPFKKSKIETIRYDFDTKDTVDFPLPNGNGIDQAFMLAVIEHVNNPEPIVKGIYNTLEDGGDFYLTTPSRFSKSILEFLSYKLKLINEEEIRDHKHYYAKDEIIDLLDRAGFQGIEHRYFQFGMNQAVVAHKPE